MRKKVDISVACLYPIRPDRIGGMDRFFWAFDQAVKDVGKSIVWFFPKSDAFQHYQNQGLQIEFISESIFECGLIEKLQNNYQTSLCVCHFVPYNTRYVSRLKYFVDKLCFVDHMSRPRIPKSLKYRLWHYLKGLFIRKHVDGIIAVSDYVKHRIYSELGGRWHSKTHVIHNGVDFNLYQSKKSGSDYFVDLFAIGYVTFDKGFQDLVQAIYHLKSETPAISCAIAGDGPYKIELENLVDKLGLSSNIRCIGNINNQYDWMRNSKVVVIPSLWYEACPFTVLESMACGSPLVVSNAGGIPELVGTTALVFPKGDIIAFSKHLKKLLADSSLQQSMGSMAAARANQHYGLDRMVKDHLEYSLCLLAK